MRVSRSSGWWNKRCDGSTHTWPSACWLSPPEAGEATTGPIGWRWAAPNRVCGSCPTPRSNHCRASCRPRWAVSGSCLSTATCRPTHFRSRSCSVAVRIRSRNAIAAIRARAWGAMRRWSAPVASISPPSGWGSRPPLGVTTGSSGRRRSGSKSCHICSRNSRSASPACSAPWPSSPPRCSNRLARHSPAWCCTVAARRRSVASAPCSASRPTPSPRMSGAGWAAAPVGVTMARRSGLVAKAAAALCSPA